MTDQLPIELPATEHNAAYMRAKRDRLGHRLHHQGLALDEEMIHSERVDDRRRERGPAADDPGEGAAAAERTRDEPPVEDRPSPDEGS